MAAKAQPKVPVTVPHPDGYGPEHRTATARQSAAHLRLHLGALGADLIRSADLHAARLDRELSQEAVRLIEEGVTMLKGSVKEDDE
jgi:hypothetical protein